MAEIRIPVEDIYASNFDPTNNDIEKFEKIKTIDFFYVKENKILPALVIIAKDLKEMKNNVLILFQDGEDIVIQNLRNKNNLSKSWLDVLERNKNIKKYASEQMKILTSREGISIKELPKNVPQFFKKEIDILNNYIKFNVLYEKRNIFYELKRVNEKLKKMQEVKEIQIVKNETKNKSVQNDNVFLSASDFKEKWYQYVKEANKEAKKSYLDLKYDHKNSTEKKLGDTLSGGNYPLLVGSPGISKTYSAKQIAQKNNIKMFQVYGTQETDNTDIIGYPILKRSSIFNGEQTIGFKSGSLLNTLKYIQKYKKPAMLLVDEISKIGDPSALISVIGRNSKGEMNIETQENVMYIKVPVKIGNQVVDAWVETGDSKEYNYYIDEKNGYIAFNEEEDEEIYKKIITSDDEEDINFRSSRGYLLKISLGELDTYRDFFKKNIRKNFESYKNYVVPFRQFIFVATANNIEDIDTIPDPIVSRMTMIPVVRDNLFRMIYNVVADRKEREEIEWNDKETKAAVLILSEVLETIENDVVFENNEAGETKIFTRAVDYRTIESIIDSIDPYDPFNSKRDIFEAIKNNLNKFISFDNILNRDISEIDNSFEKEKAIGIIEMSKKEVIEQGIEEKIIEAQERIEKENIEPANKTEEENFLSSKEENNENKKRIKIW